ncbi:MAG TPA: glycosyltransferase family 1 protein, partial [Bacillota bacterium]|nr:glycosyltransferase family 1 protein [Bacillota bacterium]
MKKKIAVVVQRYGMEVNGGAELECRYYAERLTPFYDVTVFTTCAVDYTTWENVYEEGETELNGVRVIRYPVIEPRDQEVFTEVYVRLNEAMAEDINNVDIDLQHEWMAKQGPNSPALIAAIQANKDNYEAFVFMTYLYYSTYWGLKAVPEKAILISTAHDEPPVYIPMFEEIFQSPKAIFYNTRVERTFVEGKFENSEIRNEIGGAGVDLPENIDIKGFHERNQVPEEYIVYIGRIDVSKGCQELFDDLDAYNKDRVSVGKEKIPLVLIGKPAMEIPERDDIIQLGFVSENDKYAAIVESKFLVLPS